MPTAPFSVPAPQPPGQQSGAQLTEADEKGSETAQKPPVRKNAGFFSRARALGPVKKDHGDLALLACCLVTGMVDAASFSNWGVFVGMQTGNTVILGLSTAGLPSNPHGWTTTLVSIASFLVGAFLTFRASALLTPTGPSSNRLMLASIFLFQAILLIVSAALATPHGLIPQNPGSTTSTTHNSSSVENNIRIVSLIPPLAFQSGMQIAASRLLGFNELPVNVLTSTYADLMGDAKLFALNNVKRDRRAGAVVLVLVGAIASAWLMRSSGGLLSVLWIAAGIKFMIAVGVFGFMESVTDSTV